MATVLITGSSTGIGLETALHFARHGYEVYATCRNPDGAEQLKEALAREGLSVSVVRIDVDDSTSVVIGVGEVIDRAGRVDVLVNNAGIAAGGPLELVPVEAAKAAFETNYFGAIRMIQAVLPGMREQRRGTIINVTSAAGRVAVAIQGHYTASKYALEGASEVLAQEVASFGIRVAVVEPGVILTPIFEKNAVEPGPKTPYDTLIKRLWKFYESQLRNPTLPIAVAEVILHAVETDVPKLRYLVGKDAEALMRGRLKTSDEDWVGDGAVREDEEFYDRTRDRFGLDLWRDSANSTPDMRLG